MTKYHRSHEFVPPPNKNFSYNQNNFMKISRPNYFRRLLSGLKMGDQIDCALDLMRRLPPQNTEDNLSQLVDLVPGLQDELLNAIDQPLKVAKCKTANKDYLMSTFNRDGDSFRSPWSNEYDLPINDGIFPSPKIRKLEVSANEAFDTYREMYYEGGTSSVYFWDNDQEQELIQSKLQSGFSGAVLFKKVGDGSRRMKGAWDSIHVFKANERGRNAHYKLTSTVMLYTITSKPELGNMNLSGSMTRQFEADYPIDDPSAHIANIGRMVEDIELKMLSQTWANTLIDKECNCYLKLSLWIIFNFFVYK
ncbi:unnamed protein product [Rhizophagus irregularis]|nr:unnamed protein product [Rhizophagus irregularis]